MARDDETGPGLAWPDHDTGPTPPPQYRSRPREDELPTRRKSGVWDRSKLLLFFAAVWSILVWTAMADDPILPLSDAIRMQLRSGAWVLVLAGVELIRQIHYFVSERSPGYHKFWSTKVFGGLERRSHRLSDYTRYRLGRVLRICIVVGVLGWALGRLLHEPPVLAFFKVPARLIAALPLVFQFGLLFFVIIIQFVGMAWYAARQGIDIYFPDDIKTRFTDVWGQDNVLDRVRENIVFLEDPESIEEKGGYVPAGILLWGPPGTGKTLMAEAVAGETGKPYVFVDPGGLTAFGFGALAVKGVFRKLRKLAVRYGGVVVFFDEADALGNRGQLMPGGLGGAMPNQAPWAAATSCNGLSWLDPGTTQMLFHQQLARAGDDELQRRTLRNRFFFMGGAGGGGGMLQALLTEISGLKKPRGFVNRVVRRSLGMRPKPPPKYRILVMMATNMPQALDEALLRPGRIDRIYKVGYPSKPGRIKTYEGYFAKVKHQLTEAQIDRLATITPYATGATIKDLVNEALINAIRDDRDTVTWPDVMKAKHFKDLGPSEDVEYIERERHAVAVHEACHAVVAAKVRHHLTIDLATIEKGGNYLGMVASIPPEDQFTRWKSQYEADIMVSLASLAGERLFFGGDNSSGVSGDLETATSISTMMEGYWGMGQTVASHGVTHSVGIGGGGRPGGGGGKRGEKGNEQRELLESSLGGRIEKNLGALLQRSEDLLREQRTTVLAVAHALETNKTLSGDDVMAVIEGRQGPLIDGRPYHSPAFAQVLERYHAEAEAAHRSNGRVDVPLPKADELALAAAGAAARRARNGNGNGKAEADGKANGNGHGATNGRARDYDDEYVESWAPAPATRPRRRRRPPAD